MDGRHRRLIRRFCRAGLGIGLLIQLLALGQPEPAYGGEPAPASSGPVFGTASGLPPASVVSIGGAIFGIGLALAVYLMLPRLGGRGGAAVADAGRPGDSRRRQDRLEALLETSRQLGRLQRIESLFAAIAEACQRLFESDSVAYRVVEGDELVLAGTWGHAGDGTMIKRVKIGESVSGRVALSGEPMVVCDPENDPRVLPAHREAARKMGHHGLLGVPVRIGERLVGVLVLRTLRAGGFSEHDLPIAVAFASQVAIALENARLYDDLARSNDRLRALFDTARQATVSLSLSDVLPHLVRLAVDLTGTDASSIRLLNSAETVLEAVASSGLSEQFSNRGSVKVLEGMKAQAILGGQPIAVYDLEADREYPFRDQALAEGLRSMACVPLRSRDRVIGTFSVYTRDHRRFSEADVEFFAQFANLAAIAIENGRLYRQAEERTERLKTLSTLTRLITSASDTDDVFDAVAMAAATLLRAKLSQVWVDDPESLALTLQGRFSEDGAHEPMALEVSFLPYKSGVETTVFESRTPEYIPDVQQDTRWVHADLARQAGLHAWAGIPMIARDRSVGVLSLFFEDERRFAPSETELMRLLADQAAIAIENRRSAERLKEAHSQMEQLLASFSWILIAVDEYDMITQWNGTAESTFDIPAGKVVGWPLVDCGIDWDWPWVLERITEGRSKDHPTRFDQLRYRAPDGRERVLGLTLSPIRASAGQNSGFLLVGSDITERKILESQLAQKRNLESIGQLAAGVAHEINTPIQFVGDNTRFLHTAFDDLHRLLGAYQSLRDAVAAGTATPRLLSRTAQIEQETDVDYLVSEIPNAVNQTLDGITRVATIVSALKDFAHPEQGERVATDINQALLSTLTVARNEIKYVADVQTELGDIPLVVCQPGELNQVFLNVIINAVHAIADVVGDSGDKGLIRVRTEQDGDMVLIAVSDTGCGIPENIRAKIFDPFFTTKEVGRGTGQGLSIALSVVVEKHGGSLTFETEVGRGTTFFIRLPIAGPEGKATV